MRLGQFARKHDLSPQEIISFLEEAHPEVSSTHANAKLDEDIKVSIARHFNFSLEAPSVTLEEVVVEMKEAEEQAPVTTIEEETIASKPEEEEEIVLEEDGESDSNPIEVVEDETEAKEDATIETNRLLELLESDEEVDLSKITRIKAYKKELDGLKVVGKIDLPEPKIAAVKSEEEVDTRKNPKSNKRPQLSEEEKEKRRLRAKQKQEAYEAREVKRRKEAEIKKLKELKEAHYKQKLQKAQVNKKKQKSKFQPQEEYSKPIEQRPQPKTWLGKFWRWMNT